MVMGKIFKSILAHENIKSLSLTITSPMLSAQWHHPYGKKQRGTKEPLDESERGEWKSWLKTQHSKHEDHGIGSHHFKANRWGDNGIVTDFIFLGSKITADGDCSHEIKRRLLLGRKVMTNLDSTLKSRDITLSKKVCLVKPMVFSCGHVWVWGLDCEESWVPKNWCFWTVVLDKTLKESLGLQGDPTSPFQRTSVLGVLWKEWC